MKPRLLDLFCGAGGAAMGYHRAGFDVVGVDINPQRTYPFEFVQADATTFPLDGFDAYHASPPCQEYSSALAPLRQGSTVFYGLHLETMRDRLAGTLHVIENVPGAPIANQPSMFGLDGTMLCGTMFGLGVETPNGWREVRRHRLFESSITLPVMACRHKAQAINPYNDAARKRDGISVLPVQWFGRAMGIDWETREDQVREAIPPAYTEWIGAQLMAAVMERAS